MILKEWRLFGRSQASIGFAQSPTAAPAMTGTSLAIRYLHFCAIAQRETALLFNSAGGTMLAQRITTALVAFLVSAGLAMVDSAMTQAAAQAPPERPAVRKPIVVRKPVVRLRRNPSEVIVAGRPPARVTVRKRSFLDPGTESRRPLERRWDYAYPAGDPFPQFLNNYNFTFTRSPLPSCFDIPNYCH
jgi:hypothetical protein